MIANQKALQTVYEEPAIVVADFQVNDPRHIMPMLELAVELNGLRSSDADRGRAFRRRHRRA